MKGLWILAAALMALPVLSGCAAAAQTVSYTAKANAAGAFMETESIDGLAITLSIDPVVVGDNRLVVLVDDPTRVTGVEAQVIMANMGHGAIVDLHQAAPGRYEAATNAISMDGRWMIRVEAERAEGDPLTAVFYLSVKNPG